MEILFLVFYLVIIYIFSMYIKKETSKEGFLIGDRQFGTFPMSLSIASTWIWAPALFVSAQQAYENGYVGLLYFLVPNVLTLIIFIPFAKRLRNAFPQGYSLMGFMKEKYSGRVGKIYLFQMSLLSLMSTVVQIVAGGTVVSVLTGIPFVYTSIIIGLFVYSYSRRGGLSSSIYTSIIQFILIVVPLIIIITWSSSNVGIDSVANGINGINDVTFTNEQGINLLLMFGIPTAIGLLSGPFGDQNFWQRALAVKRTKLTKSFIWAAVLFATVPILMSFTGFLGAGSGFIPTDNSMVNVEFVTEVLPQWTVIFFVFLLLSGLMSTVDSNLSAMTTLLNDTMKKVELKDLRIIMLAFVIIAILISNIPASIVDLFLFYGILRASTFGTTVLTLLNVKLSESGVFYGVIASLVIGFPIYITGQVISEPLLVVTGSIFTLIASGIVATIVTKVQTKNI